MTLLATLIFASMAAAPNANLGTWETVCGPSPVTALTGNGGLTVGLDDAGRIASCRWPSPGYHGQVSYAPDANGVAMPGQGAGWAIRVGNTTLWLSDASWTRAQSYSGPRSVAVRTQSQHPDGIEAEQTLFVHPEQDLLVARLHVSGVAEAPRVFWCQDFTPCTRLIPGLPVADWALGASNDFAVCADQEAVLHFRPAGVDGETWNRAERLAAKQAMPSEWAIFEPSSPDTSVFIGVSPLGPRRGVSCGIAASANAPARQVAAGRLDGRTSAAGACQSAIEVAPVPEGGGYTAVLLLAFGASRAAVDAALAHGRTRGYAGLLEETGRHWDAWLASGGLSLANNPEESVRRRALLTIAMATDRKSGAIVRAPVTRPPLALDFPREGAWPGLALDLAGMGGAAARHWQFYAAAVKRESQAGLPRGALPAALYTDGRAAAPPFVLDLDAAAWFVSGVWQHAAALDTPDRKSFLESTWEAVAAAMDLLAAWSEGGRGEPLHSFQTALLRDGQSIRTLLLAHAGVESGMRIAEALGQPLDEKWSNRQADLAAAVLFHILNQTEPWALDALTPVWMRQVLPENHALWRQYGDTPRAKVRIGEDEIALGEVRLPAPKATEAEALQAGFPDVLGASLRFLAATARIYGEYR